jgi:TatD DNase family protein
MYVDAHAHLDKYDSELPEILHEIERNEIFTVSVSMNPESYARSRKIGEQSQWVVTSFGVHPWDAPEFCNRLESLDPLIDASPMVGEVGLDYHFVTEPEKHVVQREVFKYFVRKGVSQEKILNIHSKGAEADVDRILGELGAKRAIIHWYSGPMQELEKLVEKGLYFSIGVEILSNSHIQAITKAIPAPQLLTETDNPGGYRWLTGEFGRPSIIRSVVEMISDIREWNRWETERLIVENFMQLARKDSWATELIKRTANGSQSAKDQQHLT